jgi:hypothetical protein
MDGLGQLEVIRAAELEYLGGPLEAGLRRWVVRIDRAIR